MFSNIVHVSLLLSCLAGAASSMVIKHNQHHKVHYIETSETNYAFVGIGTPQENFKGVSVNGGQIEVERGNCNKRDDVWDNWTAYMNSMLPSYSSMAPTMVMSSLAGITDYFGAVPKVTGMTSFTHRGHRVNARQGSIDVTAANMPMKLVKVMFIDDMVVFVHTNGRIKTSANRCLNEQQRQYVRHLQTLLSPCGIQLGPAGGLIYNKSEDKNAMRGTYNIPPRAVVYSV